MTRFRGFVEDAFELAEMKGLVLQLAQVEGLPEVGMKVSLGGRTCCIAGIGTNSTDGQIVSHRSCLTGKPVPPYCTVLLAWDGRDINVRGLNREWVVEDATR
jgi:hypothetical protein